MMVTQSDWDWKSAEKKITPEGVCEGKLCRRPFYIYRPAQGIIPALPGTGRAASRVRLHLPYLIFWGNYCVVEGMPYFS